jgi:hypothetical protein
MIMTRILLTQIVLRRLDMQPLGKPTIRDTFYEGLYSKKAQGQSILFLWEAQTESGV